MKSRNNGNDNPRALLERIADKYKDEGTREFLRWMARRGILSYEPNVLRPRRNDSRRPAAHVRFAR
jgi:hypothetical protein